MGNNKVKQLRIALRNCGVIDPEKNRRIHC